MREENSKTVEKDSETNLKVNEILEQLKKLSEKKGWNIITTNFRRRGFEIDLVALDEKKVLRFIEVKNIVDGNCIYGAESVYKRKPVFRQVRRKNYGK